MCVIGAYKTGALWITTLNQAVALQTETLGTNPCDIDPTSLWIQDMKELIQCRQQESCKIILAGVFNVDVSSARSDIHVLMSALGLREVLIEKYGQMTNTHLQGSRPIDGILFQKVSIFFKEDILPLKIRLVITDGFGSTFLHRSY